MDKKGLKMSYYFAGGKYYNKNKKLEFMLVRPTNGLPYVTSNPNGLSLTSHHSSLYLLSNDFSKGFIYSYRSGGAGFSPDEIELPEKIQKELKKSIEVNGLYE
jgi:hypothetical protein